MLPFCLLRGISKPFQDIRKTVLEPYNSAVEIVAESSSIPRRSTSLLDQDRSGIQHLISGRVDRGIPRYDRLFRVPIAGKLRDYARAACDTPNNVCRCSLNPIGYFSSLW